MFKNPFYDKGPLDPLKHKDVLVSRSDQLAKVVSGIKQGHYWIILGPREIGRTTFLRQIQGRFKNDYHISLNMQVPHISDESFYRWMTEQLIKQIPPGAIARRRNKSNILEPSHRFINFLENLKLKEEKRIILLFDEIEGIPSLENFFQVWRTVYEDRDRKKELNRYSVIITGTADLISQATKAKTPFNIAQILYMTDFSLEECEVLINKNFKKKKLLIEPSAGRKLIEQISGHPKMFQQACSILFDMAWMKSRILISTDIDEAINKLVKENTTLDMLKKDIELDPYLKVLLASILRGKKTQFHLYKHYSMAGSGPIVEDQNSCCAIRNQVYEQFLRNFLVIDNMDEADTIEILHPEEKIIINNTAEKHQVLEIIGQGGMGMVIKAADSMLGRHVAIKMLNKELFKNRSRLERFKKEARLLAGLSHPNIVTVYELIMKDDEYQMVMEFIDGKNLKDLIHTAVPFTNLQIVYIAKKITEALTHLHKHKIIHRDIKPKNIMLTREGKIKIVDFGVAVIKEGKVTGGTGIIRGTPQYMAPEQFAGEKPHYLTDIYSIGITLFHITAGDFPFDAEKNEEIREQHVKKPLPSLLNYRNDVDEEIERIIKKCAEKKPENRFQSARELLETLNFKWKSLDEAAIENELMKKIGE